MTTEENLIREIESQSKSVEPWFVYCDWLEENGSDRATAIRELLQPRLPYTPADFEKFKRWAKSAGQSPTKTDVVFGANSKEHQEDVKSISKEKIFRNFERDPDGRLPLKRRAVLSFYGSEPWSLSKQPCLVVRSPNRRRDDQCLTVEVENVILRNQPNNWCEARWLWDRNLDPPKSKLKSKDVLFKNAAKVVNQLESKSKLNEKQRQQLSTHLLDLGRYQEAFEMFGIRYDDSLQSIRNAIPFIKENPFRSKYLARWISTASEPVLNANGLREGIWHAAPWKLRQTIDRVFNFRKSKTKTKREGKLRLFAFPKQTGQSKLAVFVGCNKNGEDHRIYTEYSSVNDRLALVDWQRGFWFDMERLGIIPNRDRK